MRSLEDWYEFIGGGNSKPRVWYVAMTPGSLKSGEVWGTASHSVYWSTIILSLRSSIQDATLGSDGQTWGAGEQQLILQKQWVETRKYLQTKKQCSW